jgi:pimeloyl-ACP methyl ester carboxylesterase
MALDWIRRCYVTKFKLFSDSNATVTGRYYEVPPGTPFYPFQHIYGSADWDAKPYEEQPDFGQVRAATKKWDPGQLPVDLPLPIFVGSPGCAGRPTPIAAAIPYNQTVDGWLPKCLGIPAVLVPWFTYTSYMRCTCQLLWEWVICELYDNNLAPITALFVKLLGDVTIVYYPRIVELPRFMVIVTDDWCMVACEGTTNFQQAALEGLYSPLGPQNVGAYSTHGFWQTCANRIIAALDELGYVNGTPIFLAGHSLGGATVLVAAAVLRLGNADTRIRYFTFGAPAIGDARIVRLLESCEGMCLDNVGDPVPSVPFGFRELGPVLPLVGRVFVIRLERWLSAPRHWRQYVNGDLDPGPDLVHTTAVIRQIYSDIQAGLLLQPFEAHPTATYIQRTRRRCPGPAWPILDPLDYATITGCAEPALGWADFGGQLPPLPTAGAIAFGNVVKQGVKCSTPTIGLIGSSLVFADLDDDSWIRVKVPNGITLHAFLRCTDGGMEVKVWYGPDCAHLTLLRTLTGTGGSSQCVTRTTVTDTYWYVELSIYLSGIYDLLIDYGPCASVASGPASFGGILYSIPSGTASFGDVTTTPNDGTTCAKAILLEPGVTYNGSAGQPGIWFVFPVSPATQYHVNGNCPAGILQAYIHQCTSCSDLNFAEFFTAAFAPNCYSNTTTTQTVWIVEILTQTAAWSISADAGPC